MPAKKIKKTKNKITTADNDIYSPGISPEHVADVLRKHMLVDGFDIVFDLKRSSGSYAYDAKSKEKFLDFFTFFGSNPVGFNHPKMTTPEFLEKLAYVSVQKPSCSDSYTVEMAEFIDTFSRTAIPDYLPHVFLIEGGGLAVENALKAAFDFRMQRNLSSGFYRSTEDENRLKVIHFRRAFHGRTGYTLSLTNTDPVKTRYFPKFNWPRIHNPAISFPLNEENLKLVKQEEEISLNQIKQAIVEFGKDIAALIIEPIQAEGGDNHFRKEFFIRLRDICTDNDIIMIVDEVQTGIGLTGKMWAHQHFVEPDVVSFGKKTQVCGILAGTMFNEVIENVFNTSGRLNSTWGGNLTDMVRFTRQLQIIQEEKLVDNAARIGELLLTRLRDLESDFPQFVRNTRGRGLFCAFDMPSPRKRLELRQRTFNRNLLIIGCGERTIRFRPPLNVTASEIEKGIDIIRASLAEMESD
ncbi:MAG TPA: L-lysine 6-transaminase [Candidatus Acidoferrales bacterium]|nr:L-lysine 6-transaminase [Candidatus Acidoferrales bacterium]